MCSVAPLARSVCILGNVLRDGGDRSARRAQRDGFPRGRRKPVTDGVESYAEALRDGLFHAPGVIGNIKVKRPPCPWRTSLRVRRNASRRTCRQVSCLPFLR